MVLLLSLLEAALSGGPVCFAGTRRRGSGCHSAGRCSPTLGSWRIGSHSSEGRSRRTWLSRAPTSFRCHRKEERPPDAVAVLLADSGPLGVERIMAPLRRCAGCGNSVPRFGDETGELADDIGGPLHQRLTASTMVSKASRILCIVSGLSFSPDAASVIRSIASGSAVGKRLVTTSARAVWASLARCAAS